MTAKSPLALRWCNTHRSMRQTAYHRLTLSWLATRSGLGASQVWCVALLRLVTTYGTTPLTWPSCCCAAWCRAPSSQATHRC